MFFGGRGDESCSKGGHCTVHKALGIGFSAREGGDFVGTLQQICAFVVGKMWSLDL